jgi:asparagine synthase (glutamine-hydrolysing)
MCGLVAALGRINIRPAVVALRHRGIRDRIVETARGSVGHVRLPIVGLGEEHDQPMRRGRWIIAFVGQVLDFRERSPGAECDAPLVADAWPVLGARSLQGADGFWSVAALDEGTGALHLLVDYLAQKPLYYRSDARGIAAASEPNALLALLPEVTPDEIYFADVQKWGYCPEAWRTPYSGVMRTLPGEHVVLWPSGKVRREIADPLAARAGDADDLKREIEAAVKRRVLSSDVPMAALVSGGLDSAITYELARRHANMRIYHVKNDELGEMMEVVTPRVTGVLPETVPDPWTPPTILDSRTVRLDHALRYMQEPLDLGSLCPQVALSDAIREAGGERVCLTGDGADEFFGGYGRASVYDSQASDVWRELVAWHLPRLDRVMMRNRIEVRSPFLARRVAELALGLPWKLRKDKTILRYLATVWGLPPSVAGRPKKPLRTREVEADRGARSRKLVQMFRRERQWFIGDRE